ADADRDGDSFFDADDQCPEEGNIEANGNIFVVDDTGCQADTDGDGVKDYLDLCINDGIRGFVDPNGCMPSGAEVTPDAPLPTVSVYIIESICLYVPELNIMRLQIALGNNGTTTISGDAQWQFSNGSFVESGFWGMTDYTGDVRADFAPGDTRLYRTNIGANGFATFTSDYLTFTNPEPCFVPDAELQVTDVVCQYNMFEDRMELIFTLTNVGQGYLNADAQYTFIGATTVTNYISPFIPREPLAPNAATSFSINPDANGFATLMVAEYITYTNPTPCLPAPEATPEVTDVPEITPEVTSTPEIMPEVTPTEA
ncbi:MAG TPA: hypothetical protein PLZ51_23485, partial [Aggregatilineales bacterium]|nr:hypothetical protein [Aggregatilineales bacterium]